MGTLELDCESADKSGDHELGCSVPRLCLWRAARLLDRFVVVMRGVHNVVTDPAGQVMFEAESREGVVEAANAEAAAGPLRCPSGRRRLCGRTAA